jgi:hypothetical protein
MRHFGMQVCLMAVRMFLASVRAQSAASRDEVKPKNAPH